MIPKCPHCLAEIELPEGEDSDVITCDGCDNDFKRSEAFDKALEDIADQYQEHQQNLKNKKALDDLKPPPPIQKPKSKKLGQMDSNTAKLKSWTGNIAGLSFLSLFIPVAGLFISIPFWISSFVLCIVCLAKGEYRTGVGTMVFLMFLMPFAWFAALTYITVGF